MTPACGGRWLDRRDRRRGLTPRRCRRWGHRGRAPAPAAAATAGAVPVTDGGAAGAGAGAGATTGEGAGGDGGRTAAGAGAETGAAAGSGAGDGAGAGARSRREQPEWIDVSLVVGRAADPEVDARHVLLGRAARAHRADGVAFADGRALRDLDRAEVDERDGVAVRREDRHAAAVGRQRPGEGDDARCGRLHRRAVRAGDVDAAVLPGGVRVRPEGEGSDARRRPPATTTPLPRR